MEHGGDRKGSALPYQAGYGSGIIVLSVYYTTFKFLNVIYQLHIKDLLPEVLIPLNISLRKMKDKQIEFERIIKERKNIINLIITKAFLDFSDKIKEDVELTQSFEEFLTMLVSCDLEEAAVILDEFLLH